MRRGVVALLALTAMPASATAAPHDVDVTSVARVFLDQLGPRLYLLSVVDSKVPRFVVDGRVLPDGCRLVSAEDIGLRIVSGFAFECTSDLTFDDAITLPWPLAGVVVLAQWSDGTEASGYFRGDGRAVSVPLGNLRAGAGTTGRLAGRYLVLGSEHILFGVDHLLFIAGLLLLVRGFWPLVKTITAFTVAHSITLGAAVLGYVPVSSGPVEAAIALSIVLLAREIVMGHRGRGHLVHRHPWLVAFVFGLLHGLGFAGALGELGLRPGDIAPALLFFNLGVEAGQLAFVATLLLLYALVGRSAMHRIRQAQPLLGYALGAVAMLWFLDRLPAVVGA